MDQRIRLLRAIIIQTRNDEWNVSGRRSTCAKPNYGVSRQSVNVELRDNMHDIKEPNALRVSNERVAQQQSQRVSQDRIATLSCWWWCQSNRTCNVYTYIYIKLHIYICIYTCMHVCMHAFIHIYIHINIHMHIYTCTYTHTHIYIYIYIYIYININ